jgi:hypothetical protein
MATEMTTAQIEVTDSPLTDSYGLGLDLGGEGQDLYFAHSGGTWGSTCLLLAYPETGQGVVIMTNSRTAEGVIRLELLLSVAREYGWPGLSPEG